MTPTPRAPLARTALLLGALWVLAGALFKLFAGSPNDLPSSLRTVLSDVGFEAGLFFQLAIAIELAVVSAAILRPSWGWAPLSALFGVFAIVLVPLIVSGETSCGCFGSSSPKPGTMLAIDMVLLAGILATRPWSARPAGIGPGWLLAAIVLLSVPLPFILISKHPTVVVEREDEEDAPRIEGARWITLEPSRWIGKDVFDTELARYIDFESGQVPVEGLFVFYRWTCELCAAHMLQVIEQDDFSRPIVLVRVPDNHDTPENGQIKAWPEGGHVTKVSLPRGPAWIVDTPADLTVEGAVVTEARTRVVAH